MGISVCLVCTQDIEHWVKDTEEFAPIKEIGVGVVDPSGEIISSVEALQWYIIGLALFNRVICI